MSVTLLYQGRPRSIDAIRSYSECLTASLSSDLGHDAWFLVRTSGAPWRVQTPGRADQQVVLETVLGEVEALVVQYNPFSYARRGLAPWLPRMLRGLRRSGRRPDLAVMVHEAYVPFGPGRTAILSVLQRRQLAAILRQVDVAFASTATVADQLRHLSNGCAVVHLPVGSTVPDERHERHAQRAALQVADDQFVVATFGTAHAARLMTHLTAAVNAIARHRSVVMLNLGIGAPGFSGLDPDVRLITPGELAATEVAQNLAASDLFLSALSDGVSTRRTTFVSALQHEVAVVGTIGHNTDDLLHESSGVVLVPQEPVARFADAAVALSLDDAERQRCARDGRRLYDNEFAWPVVASRLVDGIASAHAARSP